MYEDLITQGDRDAIWRFYAFENNLIEEDPAKLLDPRVIDEADFAEAASVSFSSLLQPFSGLLWPSPRLPCLSDRLLSPPIAFLHLSPSLAFSRLLR